MLVHARRALVAVGLLLGLGSGVSAQSLLDPDRCMSCRDKWEHAGAGAAVAAAVRVWPGRHWQPWQRVAAVAALGFAFEAGQADDAMTSNARGKSGHGFSPRDLTADIVGAVIEEAVAAGLRHVFRARPGP
jgi:hypothetical protein